MRNELEWQVGPEPLVSAAMIVRNEAENLEACLRSIFGVVDEVVLLDTGSTDETVAIGRRLGARVFEEPWQDDFSLHRNHSINLCRGKWIVVIDGDEVLEDRGDLRSVLEHDAEEAGADAVVLQVNTHSTEGLCEQLFSVRAFLRGEAHYRYPVHNQLVGIRNAVPSSAVIRSSYEGPSKDRAARSIPLLERFAAEFPEEPHGPFYLAMMHRGRGDAEKTRRWAKQALELAPDAPAYAAAWVWLIYSTFAVQGADAAEQVLRRALKQHPGLADLQHARMALAAFRWSETAQNPGPYMFLPQVSLKYLKNFGDVCGLLGFPFSVGRKETP